MDTTIEDISSELLATYTNLGSSHGDYYTRGEECLACVKDLIRALRNDDSQCEIRRQLGRAGILKKDLFHILVDSGDDPVLRNDVLRLLVNLTQPAYLCFGKNYPKNKERGLMRAFMEVNQHLHSYKEAFTSETVMDVLGSMLADLSQKSWEEREDEDIIMIERILLLIRNILHIPHDPNTERRTEDDVNLHDQIIWKLHDSGINELFLFLSSSSTENQWCIHVLEIFFLLFKEQSPSILASTGREKSREERERTDILLDEALQKSREAKVKSVALRGGRHSRFGGTFVVHNHKSISGRDRIFHKPIARLNETSYDVEKRPRRTNKLRRPIPDLPRERTSTYSIRLVLKNLCVQFLQSSYNHLMKTVKDGIVRRHAMENDETYYLWCLHFFMEFSRNHAFRVDLVGETLQLASLHYVIMLCANYYESMVVEKKSLINARQWAQRLHHALKAYKEILLHIQQMGKSSEETLRESSKVIVSNILYQYEYREVIVTLLRNFQEVFQTRSMLKDLVETTHIYVQMLELHCQQNSCVMTQERRKKGTSKKKSRRGTSKAKALNEDQLVDLWETIDARVEELMEGVEPLPRSHSPFNPASQVSIEEQKLGAMGMIRMLLIEANHPEAVSLLRAAREVWSGKEFGNPGLSIDEEMEVMQSILYNTTAVLPLGHLMGGADIDDDDNEEGSGEGEVVSMETQFHIKNYLEKFANNKIVRVYSLVLADYAVNSELTNNATIKLLYSIASDLKMAPLLYHISIFSTLMTILNEPRVPRYKNLLKFACFVVRGFFEMAGKNSLMFVELLVWKTSKDCYELEEGYGIIEREKQLATQSSVWTREQEEELEKLYKEYAGEEDIIGCIEAALEGSEVKRSRKQILNQVVRQGLASERRSLYKKAPKKNTSHWDEAELSLLRQVYGELCEVVGGGEEREKELVRRITEEHFPHRGVREVSKKMQEEGWLERRVKKSSGVRRKGRGDVEEGEEGQKKFSSAAYVNTSEDDSSDGEDLQQNVAKGSTPASIGGMEGTKKYTSAEFVNTSEDESSEEDVRSERMGGQRKADLSARSVSSGRERTKTFLNSSMADSSEDDDIIRELPKQHHSNGKISAMPPSAHSSSSRTLHDKNMASHDVGVVSQDISAYQHVTCLKAAGYLEELQWLEAYLMDEARDRTVDDDWEEMSIVAPSSSKMARALVSSDFRGLLRSLGLKHPTDKEPFWMIPSSMPPQALTQAARVLGGGAVPMEATMTANGRRNHMTTSDDHMSLSNVHSNGHAGSLEEDASSSSGDEFVGHYKEERSRSDALKLLRKMKRKSPLSKPSRNVNKATKKPRLALRTDFLESDASESELGMSADLKDVEEQGGNRHSVKKQPSRNFLEEDSDSEGDNGGLSASGGVNGKEECRHGLSGDVGMVKRRFESDDEFSEEEGGLTIAV